MFSFSIDDLKNWLVRDGKTSVIRDALMKNDIYNIMRREALNYCSEAEIENIIESEQHTINLINEFDIGEKIISKIIEIHFNNKRVISLLILKVIDRLSDDDLRKLFSERAYKKILLDKQIYLTDKQFAFLGKSNLLPSVSSIYDYKLNQTISKCEEENMDISKCSLDDILFISYSKKFSEADLEQILERIINLPTDLERKGMMDTLIITQDLPDNILEYMLTNWKYNSNTMWFEAILRNQNLDNIMKYIECIDENNIKYILKNEKTDTSSVSFLYDDEKNVDSIINYNPVNLPVLSTHIHML